MSLLMKKKVIRFLLDENIPIKIKSFLEAKGYGVLLTPKGLKNGIEKLCASLEKMLRNVTEFHNKRFLLDETGYTIVD